ncbi:MAG: hypothetical protein JRH20_09865 [Deltaproteobacteria bacterium]|nr:hypothetical protein [Deltaproteobacteria bacterium]
MRRQLASLLIASIFLVTACGGEDVLSVDASVTADLPPDEPFGRACDNPGSLCAEKIDEAPLSCIATRGGATGRGFCTLNCSTPVGAECMGVPNGTWASCLIKGLQPDPNIPPPYFCAFLCETPSQSYACPPTLICLEEKDGSGRRFCGPPAL